MSERWVESAVEQFTSKEFCFRQVTGVPFCTVLLRSSYKKENHYYNYIYLDCEKVTQV